MDTTGKQHAIVIGGSMAGLVAARVLSDHYQRVTIIDRDYIPDELAIRDGTPQARHLHVLLARGQHILTDLFPGLDDEMIASGATTQNWGRDTTVYMKTGWIPPVKSAVQTHGISRMLLEWHVRKRIKANPRIQIMERTQVKGLISTPDNLRVTGVELQAKGDSNQATEMLADLVVDASGRTSNSPEWLATMGYGQVEETIINSFLGYATRWYKRPTTFPQDKKMLTIQSSPPLKLRGGVIMEIENGECIVTLAGVNKDYPPTDEAGFLEFARNLLSPAIYDIIKEAEPLSKIHGYQRTENRWRHYERFARWPEGFLVMGDAACAFNPIYGQGMTTSALEAMALDKLLHEFKTTGGDGLAKMFQTRLAKVIETPWLMATGEDLRYPGTIGGQTNWRDRLVQKYIQQLIDVMPLYPEIGDAFLQVMNLLNAPSTLFRPNILLKVLPSFFSMKDSAAVHQTLPPTHSAKSNLP